MQDYTAIDGLAANNAPAHGGDFRSRTVVLLIFAYIAYAAAAVALESYACHRFGIARRSARALVGTGKAEKLAAVRSAISRTEKEEWWAYKGFRYAAVGTWALLSAVAAVQVYRSLRKRKAFHYLPHHLAAVLVGIPALFVFGLGILPLELAPKLWQMFPALNW